MSFCSTRRHVFLFTCSTRRRHVFLLNRKTCLLAQEEDMSSCSKGRHVLLFNKKSLCPAGRNVLSSNKKTCLIVSQEDIKDPSPNRTPKSVSSKYLHWQDSLLGIFNMWLSQIELSSRVGIHFRSKPCPSAASRRELSFAVLHVLRDNREPPPARKMWLSQVEGDVKFTATKQL